MHIGLVGLGRMGNNMRTRLRAAGIEVTGYDPNPSVSDVADLGALVEAVPAPRVVWVMVPSGPIREIVSVFARYREPRCQQAPVTAPVLRQRSAGNAKKVSHVPVATSTLRMRGFASTLCPPSMT